MVEKMKKITLFIYHADKEKFLSRLQKVGVMHIDKISSGIDEITAESEERLGLLIRELSFLQSLLKKEDKITPLPSKTKTDWSRFLSGLDSDRAELAKLKEKSESLMAEIEKNMPWGEFDYSVIQKLQESGAQIKLYQITRAQYNRMDLSELPVEIISQDKANIYFMALYPKGVKPAQIEAKEESIPRERLSVLKLELDNTLKAAESQKQKIYQNTRYIEALKKEILQSRNNWIWNRTNSNLKQEAGGSVYVAAGWVPERLYSKVKEFLDKENAAYIMEEPVEHDKVPISLRNNPFARLFEPILKIFSLPNHMELDTTPFFAPFYMLFFGLCVADVGYGIILFIAALVILIFVKNKAFKPLAMLGIFLSLSVLISGLLLDDFFGMHLLEAESLPQFIKSLILFPTRNDAMSLAIMLGIVQILFGFLLKIVNQVRKHGIQGAFMPIGTIMMLSGTVMLMVSSLAKGLKIGPIPVYELIASIPNSGALGLMLVFAGIGLVLFFNSLEHKVKFYLRPLLGLWELYGLLTGIPGDILSYLRLFALGLAGGLLGHAVLNIAMLMKGDSVFNIIGMTLVLVIGNALNLAIGLLSAFVHSLRLTFVEFYKAIGFTGGGTEYDPFKLNNEV